MFSILLHLSEECCRLLDQVHSSNQSLQTQMKDAENPVTIADLTIQKTIEHVLLSFYPNINIIGEEDPATYEHIKPLVSVSEIRRNAISEEFLSKNFESRKELISKSKTSSLTKSAMVASTLYLLPICGSWVCGSSENVSELADGTPSSFPKCRSLLVSLINLISILG